jgi:hypothetical protein
MKKDLAIRALDMAVHLRNPLPSCLFHSDRGSQYCSYDYQKKLQVHGLRPSMSGKGNCYDNATVKACPMIPRIIGCCALQIIEGGTHLATEMADTAANRSRNLSAHQRVLQHPQTPFILGRHQPARVRGQGGIVR